MNRQDDRTISRRRVLRTLGAAAVGAPLSVLAQGRCMLTFGTPGCNTSDIPPVFEPTGWKTVALDHLVFQAADHTTTPNGFNLQISYVRHDNRLALPNAVRPKPTGD